MDATTVASVPMTAWQQAAIVVLFILFLGGVFAFLRWILGWTSKQQTSWQNFTKSQNQEWRDWMEAQQTQERESLAGVAKALENLSKKIEDHDGKVEDRFNQAMGAARRRSNGKNG